MLKYISIISLFFFVISCDNQKIVKKYYESGNIKEEIYLSNKLDTQQVLGFYENSKLNYQYFYKDNSKIEEIFYNKEGKLLELFDYLYGQKHGISQYYNDNNKIDKGLFIQGKLIGVLLSNLDTTSNNIYQSFFISLNDTTGIRDGTLVYDMNNNLLKEESLYYLVKGKDTIDAETKYRFDLEILVRNVDSVFTEVVLGELDKNLDFVDTAIWDSGDKTEYKLSYVPKKPGYNLLTGKIFLVWKDTIEQALYKEDFIFSHDFYVKE